MNRSKLGTCLIAALVTLAGATHLAEPAEAAVGPGACTDVQRAYAEGYADGSCGGSGGTVDSCEDNGDGGFTFAWTCD